MQNTIKRFKIVALHHGEELVMKTYHQELNVVQTILIVELDKEKHLRNGYDTCIFLNEVGKVAEGPGSCFFIVKNKEIITPKLTDSVLESITRDTILKIAI